MSFLACCVLTDYFRRPRQMRQTVHTAVGVCMLEKLLEKYRCREMQYSLQNITIT